ncbi:MAG TPA: ester cyclase [Roseiflexaceae bacterium]|nr:ester cyclase [Roseiflexaceae bacterium]
MGTEENKAIVRRFLEEGINGSNEEVFLDLLSPDVVDHYAPPGLPPGREGWNQNRKLFRSAFPDGRWIEQDVFAEGDRVVGRYIFCGTHQGEFFGIAPTGKAVTVSNIHILRLADGKIVEHWGHGDDMGMLRQLGALP